MMNYTAVVSDNGRDLTCRIYTTEPPYDDMKAMPLNVLCKYCNVMFLRICEFVCEQENSKTYGQILMKFSGYVQNGKRKK